MARESFSDRFEREARAVAALNHPNICTLHDVGPNYLVMELIDGQGLDECIQHGPLPLREALQIAIQIAEALEAAHEKGIVHRDLKPGNVKIKAGSTVKVLDFGLARFGRPTTDGSATFTADATQQGKIVGTAPYMSPEQTRGIVVDKRADIWAFGCVVYEMLTGHRAFRGTTLADVFAEVVKTEPDWGALPPHTPAIVRSLLRRCLEKEPVRRLHDIADARIEIQEGLSERNTSELQTRRESATTRWRRVAPWTIAGVATAALLATLVAPRRSPAMVRPVVRLQLTLPPGVEPYVGPAAVAFSPDGTRVAFVGTEAGNRQLYVRRLDEFEAHSVRGMEGATAIFFSPSGDSLAAISTDRVMKKASLEDGLIVPIASDVDYTTGGAWGTNDLVTFGRGGVLWQVPASGGTATQLTTLDADKGEVLHAFPASVADGKGILFTTVTGPGRGAAHIDALPVPPNAAGRRRIINSATSPAYLQTGHLIFFRDGTLLVTGFDEERLEVTSAAIKAIEQIGATPSGAPMWAVSRSGTVAYSAGGAGSRLVRVSRDGSEQPLSAAGRQYMFPRLAPSGRQLVVSAEGDLWLQDTPRQTLSKLTTESTSGNNYPVWTPKEDRVVFRTNAGLFWIAADGSGPPQAVPGTTVTDFPNSISPDNDTLIFLRTAADSAADLYVTSLRGEQRPRALVATKAHEGGGQFSPDGKWVAYASNESGEFQIFLRRFPTPDRKWLVQSGKYVTWNPNGKELFYRDGDKMMAVDISFREGTPLFSSPRVLFTKAYEFGTGQTVPDYDVSRDGQSFVMVKAEPGSSRLNVVLHAFDNPARLPR